MSEGIFSPLETHMFCLLAMAILILHENIFKDIILLDTSSFDII